MSVSFVLIVVMAVLFACGVYAMLERSLTRVLIGFLLLGNAANLLLLIVMGQPGVAPFYDGETDSADMSDALPQALALTAIVITFGISAFLLALIYRSWQLGQADTVIDDAEDVAIRTRTAAEPEDAIDDESRSDDEDVTTDFVGDIVSPIRILQQGDMSRLVNDAPVDRVAVGRDRPQGDTRRPEGDERRSDDGELGADGDARDPEDGDRS
ncbi:Na(+)/H(+) antiporter subunit C [Microbacterium sp. ACRRU]|uniref:Na(+)/H(+) antiporter subunit C n=1 Tax=Microbacterium TaxID=33882 RepID=UPI001EF728BC|nr:Na(+)/H(+) antiporter subunit C [Microbacterium sp. ACRRU]MCG7417467.1 Na(+)/H(+) antiporter subunit C [Microbacterium sp. ACRRU]